FDVFQAKLPAFDQFFTLDNAMWFALALGVSKVLHEFGHGLTCKHFGGECHEMGVMLLVLTPCLYVNVSDSWMLPNRWHRAAIGAAGMYVELVLASICTFLWWFSEPGLFNYLCLNVMFVSSVSTVLFNANPLLRYDGYYILADILEIPNLRAKASSVMQRKAASWLLGIAEAPDPFLPEQRQWLFAAFAVAAAVYRWIVTFSILWFLHRVFQPYGLQVIGHLLAGAAVWGLAVMPLWQAVRFFYAPGRIEKVNKLRATCSAAALAVATAAVLLLPLPHYVECPFTIEPHGAQRVYVAVPGRLAQIHVASGERVQRGKPLATLVSTEVDLALAQLTGEREQLLTRLADLHRRQFQDADAALEVAEVDQSLQAMEEQLSQRQRDQQALAITAPVDGVIMPPPQIPTDEKNKDELPFWTGTPLEKKNLGSSLDAGVMLCQVGNPGQFVAMIDIDQSQVAFVRESQTVRLKFDALPGDTTETHITQLAQLEQNDRLAGSSAAVRHSVEAKLLDTKYRASALVTDDAGLLVNGEGGRARIRVANTTLGQRAWRYLNQTFRFSR
ncbi:MAG: biotin/lipoyl-binding protein, partial [Planctomycetales bacterium]|nr:biotin/lipoyl-binding protein [Planctomycetales bacterium]